MEGKPDKSVWSNGHFVSFERELYCVCFELEFQSDNWFLWVVGTVGF